MTMCLDFAYAIFKLIKTLYFSSLGKNVYDSNKKQYGFFCNEHVQHHNQSDLEHYWTITNNRAGTY